MKPAVLFLDANVLFSAAWSPDGRAAALFLLAERGRCRLVSSGYAIEEARRNIEEKMPEAIPRLKVLIEKLALVPEADLDLQADVRRSGLDLTDVPILAAAIRSADLLVTGDTRHFGRLMGRKFHRLEVVGLAEIVSRLLRASG